MYVQSPKYRFSIIDNFSVQCVYTRRYNVVSFFIKKITGSVYQIRL